MVVEILPFLGATGVVVCVAALVALHLLPTGYHPVVDAVSNYGVGKFGALYRVQAFSSGVGGACLLALIVVEAVPAPRFGMVALGCYAVSRMLIIAFPTDLAPPLTPRGAVHMVLAFVTFAGIAVAAGRLTGPLVRGSFSAAGGVLAVAAYLTIGAAAATFVAQGIPSIRRFFGAIERLLYLGILLWLGILFAGRLLSL